MPRKIGPKKPFIHFIAEHRLKHGLTQKQLEERLGAKPMTVSRWENYEVRVDFPTLAAVAEALGGDMMEAEDLLHHPDQPSPNQLLRTLPKDDQDYVMRTIKDLQKYGRG